MPPEKNTIDTQQTNVWNGKNFAPETIKVNLNKFNPKIK